MRLLLLQLLRCGKFYPSWVKTAEDRLKHYSQLYPCVEIDTSTYAIPRRDAVDRWVKATPAGFLFHVKAFGIFTNLSCPLATVPNVQRYQRGLILLDALDQRFRQFL